MTVEMVRGVLLWSGIINYGNLIIWVVASVVAREPYHRLARIIGVSAERYDLLQLFGMLLYKLGILLFNFVPYLALWIVA
jgi:hypothetical protein